MRPAGRERVTVLEERSGRVRLLVDRDAPGWLVALITRFPGWRATVDGRSTPVARAKVAWSAVPVSAGAHEVLLEHRPVSVRYLERLINVIAADCEISAPTCGPPSGGGR